ncbi:LysM domain-containing protein [Pseudoalteromonas sp. MMG024]|uniref:LysM peptidoglycan-binding domain-containing protein n=1 Tax=Pseudoalteromonas sp. MMG024 TaxID=2909980 RepID=UPI001F169033|nr:LysM domain-containing protein [Pseudoalteromonas sp. MMG024]MCF6459122.1 LysM peptidoglycan-binding domain-containing protein [Pseudoalteromonas sp. MMG024]
MQKALKYTVQLGDTIATIAHLINVSAGIQPCDIEKANPNIYTTPLTPFTILNSLTVILMAF